MTPGKSRPTKDQAAPFSRRTFVKSSAAVGVGALAAPRMVFASSDETINVGVIGCGGRGTGAAINAIDGDPRVKIVALADVFTDRLNLCRSQLAEHRPARGTVNEDRCWSGFDAYHTLLASDVDLVILATPPHFRPAHFAAAIDAGCHVFMEKPVAVDPTGVRLVIAKAKEAKDKNLSVVAGTQRRHEACYREAIKRIHEGHIGPIRAARCYWNMGELWHKQHDPRWSNMEWQLRNWLYFTWLSGDHIVEQHVHNIDAVNWAIGALPVKAIGMGGRQVRTDKVFGNIFDHFAIDFEYPDGVHAMSMCRQTAGCASRVEEAIVGTQGQAVLSSGRAEFTGPNPWRYEKQNPNPYVVEHTNLVASITGSGPYLNEAQRVAQSTLCAIMGRMSAYTGQEVTWEQAMNASLDLSPSTYSFDDPAPVRPVAIPGKTQLI